MAVALPEASPKALPEALPEAIEGVKDNLANFSTSLTKIYRQNIERYSEEWAKDIFKLRSKITRTASEYANTIIPTYTDLLNNLDDFFEHYLNFTFEAWVDNLAYIEPDAERCTKSCSELVEEHIPILTKLKKRQMEAGVLINRMEDEKEEHEKERDDFKILAQKKEDNANIWCILFTGLSAYYKYQQEGEQARRDAASRDRQVYIDQNNIHATKDVSDALEKVIDGLEKIAGCITIAGNMAKKGSKKIKASHEDKRIARLHYDEMRSEARRVRCLCTLFQARLPAIKSDFLSIF